MERIFTIPEITHADGDPKNVRKVIISTETVNRYGQSVLASGYDIRNFRKNPVFLQNHGYRNSDIIGRWLELEFDKKNGIVRGTNEYFSEKGEDDDGEDRIYSDDAVWALHLANMGVAAFSIGFDVLEAVMGSDIASSKKIPDLVKEQNPSIVFTKIELLEVSQVVIPANPDAVVNESNPFVRHLFEIANEKKFYKRPVQVNAVSRFHEELEFLRREKELNKVRGILAEIKAEKHEAGDPEFEDTETYIDKIWRKGPAELQKGHSCGDH